MFGLGARADRWRRARKQNGSAPDLHRRTSRRSFNPPGDYATGQGAALLLLLFIDEVPLPGIGEAQRLWPSFLSLTLVAAPWGQR